MYKNVDLHLMVTSMCDRNCKYCCNKQYDLNDIAYVTVEELKTIKKVYLTGGEPFIYSNPTNIAKKLKMDYHNIESVIVYTNANEFLRYIKSGGKLTYIDGVSVSIKSVFDLISFDTLLKNWSEEIKSLTSNRLYVFDSYFDAVECPDNWVKMKREWQENFKPASNCIFRRI